MKKTALALALILTLLIMFGMQFVKLVEANAFPLWWRDPGAVIDPIPGTVPPKITFLSPKDNTTHSGSELNLTVDLTNPQTPFACEISGTVIFFLLDGWQLPVSSDPHDPYYMRTNPYDGGDRVEIVLHDLSNGTHELWVSAGWAVEPGNWTVFFMESNSTVFFNTISTATPSPSPEPAGTPEAASQPATLPATLVFVGSVGIALAVTGSFLHIKKRREGKTQ